MLFLNVRYIISPFDRAGRRKTYVSQHRAMSVVVDKFDSKGACAELSTMNWSSPFVRLDKLP